MKSISVVLVLCCFTFSCLAGASSQLISNSKTDITVLQELSRRSGLPEVELADLLANCDANQQSMYFCAWRDQIAAVNIFTAALDEKQKTIPQCKEYLDKVSEQWSGSREKNCEKSTAEWSNGSMKQTAKLICETKETMNMKERLNAIHSCK